MHKTHHFGIRNTKISWGGGTTLSPDPAPLGTFGARPPVPLSDGSGTRPCEILDAPLCCFDLGTRMTLAGVSWWRGQVGCSGVASARSSEAADRGSTSCSVSSVIQTVSTVITVTVRKLSMLMLYCTIYFHIQRKYLKKTYRKSHHF